MPGAIGPGLMLGLTLAWNNRGDRATRDDWPRGIRWHCNRATRGGRCRVSPRRTGSCPRARQEVRYPLSDPPGSRRCSPGSSGPA